MSGVFRNTVLTPHPLTARGVTSSEDARHCFVLYICKYFAGVPFIASESAKDTAVLSLALLNFGGNGINVALLLIACRHAANAGKK
jgi:hypothetical protein